METETYEQRILEEYHKIDKKVSWSSEKDESGNFTQTEFRKHFDKWNFFDFEKTFRILGEDVILKDSGQIFLYEKFEDDGNKQTVFYPKIGIYLNCLPCDQTIEMEWVNTRRTWEYHKHYERQGLNPMDEPKKYLFADCATIIQRQPQWCDYLMIYGVWDRLPKWQELRKYYERTWWFHKTIEEKRDIQINSLLK